VTDVRWSGPARLLPAPGAVRQCGGGHYPREHAVARLDFSQSNPAGVDQGDVPALLRRLADSVAALGDVTVEDITFSSSVTDGEDDLTMTVYYHPEPRRR
jgi:hypothetical protein